MRTLIPFRNVYSLNPFGLFNDVEKEVNRFFNDDVETLRKSFIPAMDVADKKDNYLLTVDLPGMTKKDVEIKVHEGTLFISGERKIEKNENGYRERSYGQFKRSFTLPKGVKTEGISANFENGVLSISVPKGAEEQVKVIEIKEDVKA